MKLYQQGAISTEFLIIYGISGELPEEEVYLSLSSEEKQALWEDRMDKSFGPDWKRHIKNLPAIFQELQDNHNWLKDGF